MSMILDALTRAEHERQLEQQPDLKFVSPVKPTKKTSTIIWPWIVLVLLANLVILAIFLRPGNDASEGNLSNGNLNGPTEMAANNIASETALPITESTITDTNEQAMLDGTSINSLSSEVEVVETNPTLSTESPNIRPLAMELDPNATEDIDRPLIYEAKQSKNSAQSTQNNALAPVQEVSDVAKEKGVVSFSQTELNVDEAAQSLANAPKLLIDQGEAMPSSSAPNLKDLPESSRSNLKQYEVNVHVFDDNPERRFVLINMDKYKEGDRIANNGPLVQEITREGVVVDYGAGHALLPPN